MAKSARNRTTGHNNGPLDVLVNTADINKWREGRSTIKAAKWLTQGLVESGALPEEFRDTRVAPIVIGLASVGRRHRTAGNVRYLKAAIDPDYLIRTPAGKMDPSKPETLFNPHSGLKNSVRKHFSDNDLENPHFYPGYVFPDVAGGAAYLDNQLSDSDCTAESLAPASRILSDAYEIGVLCVGTEALVSNEYGYSPDVSIPSLVRTTLAPGKNGLVTFAPRSFMASYLDMLGDSK